MRRSEEGRNLEQNNPECSLFPSFIPASLHFIRVSQLARLFNIDSADLFTGNTNKHTQNSIFNLGLLCVRFLSVSVCRSTNSSMPSPRHLMSLADLSVKEINHVLHHSLILKHASKRLHKPLDPTKPGSRTSLLVPTQSLARSTIALLFSKRSTRTRVAAETAAVLLGGRALFLGREDIQLGVNETVADSARVLSSMCQGLFARVGAHSEIEVSLPIYRVHNQVLDPVCSRISHNTQTYLSSTHYPLTGTLPKSLPISSRCTKTHTSKTRPGLHIHHTPTSLRSLLCDLSRSPGWVIPRMSCTTCSSHFPGWDIRCE